MSERGDAGIAAAGRLDTTFRRLRQQGRTALLVYITAGHPDLDTTRRLVPALFAAGADVVELGVPFSDPLADGPTIQQAAQRALDQGVAMDDVLMLVRQLRDDGVEGPLVCLCYANTLLATGMLQDPQPMAMAGFDAVIVPDIPSSERGAVEGNFAQAGLHLIPFLTPTRTEAQMDAVAAGAGGFIYCVSVTGVTGARQSLPATTVELLRDARSRCRRPVAVGFGVSGPAAARQLAGEADGVIVGSALVERIESASQDPQGDPIQAAAAFVDELRRALDEAAGA